MAFIDPPENTLRAIEEFGEQMARLGRAMEEATQMAHTPGIKNFYYVAHPKMFDDCRGFAEKPWSRKSLSEAIKHAESLLEKDQKQVAYMVVRVVHVVAGIAPPIKIQTAGGQSVAKLPGALTALAQLGGVREGPARELQRLLIAAILSSEEDMLVITEDMLREAERYRMITTVGEDNSVVLIAEPK